MDLIDSVVVLTGAAGSIGRATALELLSRGAQIVAVDNNASGLEALVQEIGDASDLVLPLAVDVSDEGQVTQVAERALARFGHADALINNAGLLSGIGVMWEVDPARWWNDLRVNLFGTFLCIRAFLPGMMDRDQGVILNMVGGGLDTPNPAGSGYGCSKVALARLTDTLAEEVKEYPGIRVFALAPGFIRSKITDDLAESPAAQPWFQFVRDWLAEGKDNPAEGVATALCDMIEQAEGLPPGRIFRYSHDMAAMAERADEIVARDTQQVRFVEVD